MHVPVLVFVVVLYLGYVYRMEGDTALVQRRPRIIMHFACRTTDERLLRLSSAELRHLLLQKQEGQILQVKISVREMRWKLTAPI